MGLNIQIDKFEGPLGLLLYLIRKDEMDIFDINIHHITQQYLEYIKVMKKLDLEVAGEFIAMAATLIQIKSQMLLPTYNEDGELVEDQDPRKELVQKLLEYQKYQEVSHKLYERPLLGRDIWLRGQREVIKVEEDDEVEVDDNPLFSLISAYRFVVKTMKKKTHKVVAELQSIAERVLEIKEKLLKGQRVLFRELLNKETVREKEGLTGHILITFLSLLELGKVGLVSLFQAETLGDIYVEAKKDIEGISVDSMQGYDYVDSADAEALFSSPSTVSEVTNNESEEIQDAFNAMNEKVKIDPNEKVGVGLQGDLLEDHFQVEAATDEEINEEEKKLNLGILPVHLIPQGS